MPGIAFSLTEKFIINSALTLQAPLSLRLETTWGDEAWQIAQSQILARITAVFTSVFAAGDAAIHVTLGLYKGSWLLLRTVHLVGPLCYNRSAVTAHFSRAVWFIGLTVIGSVAGTIWPGIFKYCRYAPSPLANLPPSSEKVLEVSQRIEKNANGVVSGLGKMWDSLTLSEEKKLFVQTFSHDADGFEIVRKELASKVYQPQNPRHCQINWLSDREVQEKEVGFCSSNDFYTYSFFYHATPTEKNLESILKSRKIEVHYEKMFRGAFVSTKPEAVFGNFILGFKKSIERLSDLEHGFRVSSVFGKDAYWAGFSHDIPVEESTLAYIILAKGNAHARQTLKERCKEWTGRDIQVLSLNEAQSRFTKLQNLHLGIPKEWPSEDPLARVIKNTLQTRAELAMQEENKAQAQ